VNELLCLFANYEALDKSKHIMDDGSFFKLPSEIIANNREEVKHSPAFSLSIDKGEQSKLPHHPKLVVYSLRPKKVFTLRTPAYKKQSSRNSTTTRLSCININNNYCIK
jgi:hypothetical protein